MTEDEFPGDAYIGWVHGLAVFIHGRVKVGEGVTADRILDKFGDTVKERLKGLTDDDAQRADPDNIITVTMYRADLEDERNLGITLDDEIWDDLKHSMERDSSLLEEAVMILHYEWEIGDGKLRHPDPWG
jgi:hypothetical protein